jgi:Putative MetA-pathway of phenol degradation
MHNISVSDSAFLLWRWLSRAMFCPLIWLTILAVSTAIQAEEEAEDFTTLSIEELLEVEVNKNFVSVLTSHIHKQDDWMIGYRYMNMEMEGNRDGKSDVSTASVLADFAITPTTMRMESHMMSLMYAPSDDLTVMAMLPYKSLSMEHVTRMGANFTTRSEGIGDLTALANYVFIRAPLNRHLISVQGGMSFPTGSIDEKDDLPAGANLKLPYPMQLGSGTYDLKLGGNYQYFKGLWSLGASGLGTVRLGENDNDYRLGNILQLDSWLSYEWANWLSTTFRLDGKSWGNISGADPDLNPAMVPTADPERRGGTRIDMLIGVELFVPGGKWSGNRFGIDFGLPIYQNLEGPQLETDWMLMAGWQWVF